MKIMHTMASEVHANRRKRRFYSAELKTQVMQECRQPGASIASVALSHGINAHIVHRWLREGVFPGCLQTAGLNQLTSRQNVREKKHARRGASGGLTGAFIKEKQQAKPRPLKVTLLTRSSSTAEVTNSSQLQAHTWIEKYSKTKRPRFASPYMIGFVKDLTQSTDIGMYVLSGCMFLSALLVIVAIPARWVNR